MSSAGPQFAICDFTTRGAYEPEICSDDGTFGEACPCRQLWKRTAVKTGT